MVKKTTDGQYVVVSEKGKKLSKPTSKKKAKERLAEIEYFKHKKGKK